MKKIKIIHIHDDFKFIYDSKRCIGEYFENDIFILDHKNPYNKQYHNSAHFFEPRDISIDLIINKIKGADIVFIYGLDRLKSKIVNRIPAHIKIVWRFFGYELYKRKVQEVISTSTKKAIQLNPFKEHIKKYLPFRSFDDIPFYRALNRIDIMLCLFEEEYDFLSEHWNNLPQFLLLNFDPITFNVVKSPNKSTILLGNSKSIYNNHLDILDYCKSARRNGEYEFKMFFSYGQETSYTREIRKKLEGITNFELIEDFLPKEKYQEVYDNTIAFVHNSLRQMAVDNIMIALAKGVKIYLNERNPTYHWLKRKGFLIYSVDDLSKDIDSQNLSLSSKDINKNLLMLKELKNNYSKKQFQKNLLQLTGLYHRTLIT